MRDEAVVDPLLSRVAYPDRPGDLRGHERRVGDVGELDEERPIHELGGELGGDREGQARLAGAAGTGQGHEADAGCQHKVPKLRHLGQSPHQW